MWDTAIEQIEMRISTQSEMHSPPADDRRLDLCFSTLYIVTNIFLQIASSVLPVAVHLIHVDISLDRERDAEGRPLGRPATRWTTFCEPLPTSWNADEQRLYWLDIKGRCFYSMDVRTKHYERFEVGTQIGVMAQRKVGGKIMATDKGFALWGRQTRALTVVANPIEGQLHRRFNDGNIDSRGRFWAGVMCDPPETCKSPQCALYRFDPDGSLHKMDTGLGMPKGLVTRLMGYTDGDRYPRVFCTLSGDDTFSCQVQPFTSYQPREWSLIQGGLERGRSAKVFGEDFCDAD